MYSSDTYLLNIDIIMLFVVDSDALDFDAFFFHLNALCGSLPPFTLPPVSSFIYIAELGNYKQIIDFLSFLQCSLDTYPVLC